MPSQPVKTLSGRKVIVTERAQYREDVVPAPRTAKAAKQGKTGPRGPVTVSKQPEFAVNTLPSNPAAKRSKTIDLQARAVAVPSPRPAVRMAAAEQQLRTSAVPQMSTGPFLPQMREITDIHDPPQAPLPRNQMPSTTSSSVRLSVSTPDFRQSQMQYALLPNASSTAVQQTRDGAEALFDDDEPMDQSCRLGRLTHTRPPSQASAPAPSHYALMHEDDMYAPGKEAEYGSPSPLETEPRQRRHADEDMDDGHEPPARKQARIQHLTDNFVDAAATTESGPGHNGSVADDEELDEDHPPEVQIDLPLAQRIKELDGKPKASDYDSATQEILALAIQFYKAELSTQDAFPGRAVELRWAKAAWNKSRELLDIQLQYNSELIKMIIGYTSNLRGEIKTAARANVAHVYGFEISANPTVIARNRARYEMLKAKDTFVWRKRAKNNVDCKGLYEAKIFQLVAAKVYFKRPTDDGVALREYYQPFPLVAIALIATAAQCAIDEWAKGTYSGVTFSDSAYSAEYARHLKNLERYTVASPDAVNSLCVRLFEDGCVAAGVKLTDDEEEVPDVMNDDVFARAAADYKARGGRVSDCEDGNEDVDED